MGISVAMGILSFLSPHVISGSMTIKPFFDIIFCWLELLLRWAHQTQKQQSSCQQGSSSTRSSTSTPRECSSLHVEQIRAPSSRIRNHERFSRCAAASCAFQPSGNTGIVSGGPPSHQVELQPHRTRKAGPYQSLA